MGRAAFLSLSLLLVLSIAGCGGDGSSTTGDPGGTGAPHVPSLHVIYPDTTAPLLNPNTFAKIGPFSLPSATVSYVVTERTNTVTQDTWTLGIGSAGQIALATAGQNAQLYAFQSEVVGGKSGSAVVPADTYYLVVECDNFIDDCVYSYAVSATY